MLSGLLDEMRSSGAIFGRSILDPPWSARFADRPVLTLLTMLRGTGWIIADGEPAAAIAEGEVGIVIGPEPFTVADTATATVPPLFVLHPDDRCTDADGEPLGDRYRLGVRTCGVRLDGDHVLLSCSYNVRGRLSGRLTNALPRVLVVPHTGQLCAALELTAAEVERDEPGQQAVLDRLLDLLLLSALREWFARPEVEAPAWYRASLDPVVGRALRLLHDEPARAWTVAELAAEAGVSRATFARRFTELLGEPPKSYLTSWRLTLAADLLSRTERTVDAIARQVGFSNAYALSVAFKRLHGTRPSAYRT